MHRDAEEHLIRHLGPVAQHRDLPVRVERLHQAVLHEPDAALRECGEDRLRGVGRRRNRRPGRGSPTEISLGRPTALRGVVRKSCSSSAVSLGAGGHLNDFPAHADDSRSQFVPREDLAQGEGSRDRVELVAALHQPRRRRHVVVGAERDHEHVGLERSSVCNRPPGSSFDRIGSWTAEIARPASRYRGRHDGRRRGPGVRTSRRASRSRSERSPLTDERDVQRVTQGVGTESSSASSPPNPTPRTTTLVFMLCSAAHACFT